MGSLLLSASPRSHQSVTRSHPPPPPRPGPGRLGCRHVNTRGFSAWWAEGGAGPEDQRLPEAGPSALPPPSDSAGGAGPRAAGEAAGRGESGFSPGPGAARVSLRTLSTGTGRSGTRDRAIAPKGRQNDRHQEDAGSPGPTRGSQRKCTSWVLISLTPKAIGAESSGKCSSPGSVPELGAQLTSG